MTSEREREIAARRVSDEDNVLRLETAVLHEVAVGSKRVYDGRRERVGGGIGGRQTIVDRQRSLEGL